VSEPRVVITLTEVREALNVPDSILEHDGELYGYAQAATAILEDLCGPLLNDTRVETHDGGDRAILLDAYPTSITSVVEDGRTLAATEYRLGRGGALHRVGGTWRPEASVVVTYAIVPPAVDEQVRLAATELVRHLYAQGQVGNRPAVDGEGRAAYQPMGFAVPNRVKEILGDRIASTAPTGFH
jgi:hypothetical protein